MNTIMKNSNKILHIEVPAKAEYLSLLRLVVAGVANTIGFSNDSVADVKVALSEASSNVIRHAYRRETPEEERIINIDCYDDDGSLVIDVADNGSGMTIPPPPSEGLGFGIMSSVMDKVDVETDNRGTSVKMRKLAISSRKR